MTTKYQRRHYRDMAETISNLRLDALDRGDMFALQTAETFRDRMIEVFTRDNPRFSRARFLSACETGSSTPKRTKGR